MKRYEELKQTIVNHINDRTWSPGERLPVESYFCETFGVSRITVQRAKNELEAEGYLERVSGRKGHFVRRQPTGLRQYGLVGVTIDDISIPFAATILKGIQDRLRENDLHTVICSGIYDPASIESFVRSVMEKGCDGFIYTPIMGPSREKQNLRIVDLITTAGLPLVFADRAIPGQVRDSVSSNNYTASYQMTRKLIEAGKRRILVVKGVDCSSISERWRGHEDALADAGLEVDRRLCCTINDLSYLEAGADRPGCGGELLRFMTTAPDFDSCFCLNHISFELLNSYLSEKDAGSLRHLIVAVYDFQSADNQRFPFALHSVIQPTYRVGWEAAGLLIGALQDPDHPTIQMTVNSKLLFHPGEAR